MRDEPTSDSLRRTSPLASAYILLARASKAKGRDRALLLSEAGSLFRRMQRFETASALFATAACLLFDPRDRFDLKLRVVCLYRDQDRWSKTYALADHALAIAPRFGTYHEGRALLTRARASTDGCRPHLALADFDAADPLVSHDALRDACVRIGRAEVSARFGIEVPGAVAALPVTDSGEAGILARWVAGLHAWRQRADREALQAIGAAAEELEAMHMVDQAAMAFADVSALASSAGYELEARRAIGAIARVGNHEAASERVKAAGRYAASAGMEEMGAALRRRWR